MTITIQYRVLDVFRRFFGWFGPPMIPHRWKVTLTMLSAMALSWGVVHKSDVQNTDRVHDIACEGRASALRFQSGLHRIAVAFGADEANLVIIDSAIEIPEVHGCPT